MDKKEEDKPTRVPLFTMTTNTGKTDSEILISIPFLAQSNLWETIKSEIHQELTKMDVIPAGSCRVDVNLGEAFSFLFEKGEGIPFYDQRKPNTVSICYGTDARRQYSAPDCTGIIGFVLQTYDYVLAIQEDDTLFLTERLHNRLTCTAVTERIKAFLVDISKEYDPKQNLAFPTFLTGNMLNEPGESPFPFPWMTLVFSYDIPAKFTRDIPRYSDVFEAAKGLAKIGNVSNLKYVLIKKQAVVSSPEKVQSRLVSACSRLLKPGHNTQPLMEIPNGFSF